jgi:hypothetical protein
MCPAKLGKGPCVSSFFEDDKPEVVNDEVSNLDRINKEIELIDSIASGNTCPQEKTDERKPERCYFPEPILSPAGSTNVSLNNNVLPYI